MYSRLIKRFLDIEASLTEVDAGYLTPCWEGGWAPQANGYIQVDLLEARESLHRLMWLVLVGPIAVGLHLDHLCANKVCCRPSHLEPVTPSTNRRRAIGYDENWYPCGHPRTGENTYLRPGGGSAECVTCRRARRKARR